jgi:bifunctional oligoribonuclease and PAP phosphatase NrnA
MINFELLKEIIHKHNSFLLTTHVNPDADAIGSEIALYNILKLLGKEVHIINHSPTPYNLLFLDPDGIIEVFEPEKHKSLFKKADLLVALDFNRSDRIISMRSSFLESESLKICIDHHQEPEDFADHYFIDTDYSATGQILFDFIKYTAIVPLDNKTALPIYAAIMTDTGSFRYERTSPEIHHIAAELLKNNVSPSEVYDAIYDQSRFGKIKLLGEALSSMKLYGKNNEISYIVVSREDFRKADASEVDTDGFVSFCMSVQGVQIGLMFVEMPDGFKVSFRSKGKIPVNKLAGEFGGGGHTNASGARLKNMNLIEQMPFILKKAEEYLTRKE